MKRKLIDYERVRRVEKKNMYIGIKERRKEYLCFIKKKQNGCRNSKCYLSSSARSKESTSKDTSDTAQKTRYSRACHAKLACSNTSTTTFVLYINPWSAPFTTRTMHLSSPIFCSIHLTAFSAILSSLSPYQT